MSFDSYRAEGARLAAIRPSARVLAYQQLEFYAFVHFTVNTFTDREWGDGTEPESVFNPTELDPEQWAREIAGAGMRGLILTCKHHDGFCLWPSAYTEHSVKNSPCGRDVVRETAEACRRHGLKFGVYLSPWDRNSTVYGSGKLYDDYYVAQLTELLTGYGPVFSVWLDGACGEGPNGKRQVYDFARYFETVRTLQPDACIAICGPDVRWCGNEAGKARASEWSVVPARLAESERTAAKSQSSESDAERLREISAQDADLGSREALAGENDLIWYPAEVDTSIRPGWFWHESENDRVRPLEELVRVYETSVGGNAMLLLNIPPDTRGKLHESDVARLRELGGYIRDTYSRNLASDAEFTSDADDGVHTASRARTDSAMTPDGEDCYIAPDSAGRCELTLRMPEKRAVSRAVLRENIAMSQRVEEFAIDVDDGGWREIYRGTVIGNKKIAVFDETVTTDAVRVRILGSRAPAAIQFIGLY